MQEIPQEGEFVESGTFRVDAARMAQVLSRYQFETPDMFIPAWLRCAVASGASEVGLERASEGGAAGFELSFDGRPFTKDELLDPYSRLLDGSRDRGSHLAAGLLALLRTEPASIKIFSGGAAVNLAGAAGRAPEESRGGGRTVIRVLWKGAPKGLLLERVFGFPVLSAASLSCYPLPVRAPGGRSRPFNRSLPPANSLAFDQDGRRGFISPLEDDGSAPPAAAPPKPDSPVRLHVLGACVESVTVRTPWAPVRADVNDDALVLDASCRSCVRDGRFEETLAFVKKQVNALLQREMALQKVKLGEAGRLLKDPDNIRLWRARMNDLAAWKSAGSPSRWKRWFVEFRRWLNAAEDDPPAGIRLPAPKFAWDGHPFFLTASRTWWLRDICRRTLKGRAAAPEDKLLRALWETPVLLSTAGKPLSLAAVHKRAAAGRLNVSKRTDLEAGQPHRAVWLASRRDERFLEEWFPGNAMNRISGLSLGLNNYS